MLAETASAQELWWTLMALPGLLLSLYLVVGAGYDLHRHWTDGLRPMGWIGLGKAVCVFALAALLIWVGFIAMETPAPTRPENIEASEKLAGFFLVIDAVILALTLFFVAERAYIVPHIHTEGRP